MSEQQQTKIVVNGFEFTQSEIVSVTVKRNGVETFIAVPKDSNGKVAGFSAVGAAATAQPDLIMTSIPLKEAGE